MENSTKTTKIPCNNKVVYRSVVSQNDIKWVFKIASPFFRVQINTVSILLFNQIISFCETSERLCY